MSSANALPGNRPMASQISLLMRAAYSGGPCPGSCQPWLAPLSASAHPGGRPRERAAWELPTLVGSAVCQRPPRWASTRAGGLGVANLGWQRCLPAPPQVGLYQGARLGSCQPWLAALPAPTQVGVYQSGRLGSCQPWLAALSASAHQGGPLPKRAAWQLPTLVGSAVCQRPPRWASTRAGAQPPQSCASRASMPRCSLLIAVRSLCSALL